MMNGKIAQIDLFGNETISEKELRKEFLEPPFSVLDTKSGIWQNKRNHWISFGIKSEIGREENLLKFSDKCIQNSSIFDPHLCEILYTWFCPKGGIILDPFAGGSVRGIVAHYLGYKYVGIDIRKEQIDNNKEQAKMILKPDNQPSWYVGDSNIELGLKWNTEFDFIFSCPPYYNLEKYSELPGELSNADTYNDFLKMYENIINKSCKLLKNGCYACFVVGEIRDKNGYYIGFVPDTIKIFQKVGMKFYNDAILLNTIGSACIRARGYMKSKKLAKIHQNILVFKKVI